MKYKIVITIFLWFFFLSFGVAQDLIIATQNGQYNGTAKNANRISQELNSLKSAVAFENVSLFNIGEQKMKIQHEKLVSNQVYLTIDRNKLSKLSQIKKDFITLDIPVSSKKNFQLELMKVNILSDDFQVTTNDGTVIYNKSNFPGSFYQGIIKGNTNSIVAISIFDDHLSGLIADDFGNYVLGKIEKTESDYILYNDRELKIKNDFTCGVEDDIKQTIKEEYEEGLEKSTSNDCIDIYMEVDYDTYVALGNSTNTVSNYVSSLFNQVRTIFANEAISIQLSGLMVWQSPDPYLQANSSLEVIQAFQNYRTSFNGNLAHLLYYRDYGGRGAVNVLCNPSVAHGVSGIRLSPIVPFPTYSWDTFVVSHELGHNFGSPHTHACAWNGNNTAIDGCGTVTGCNNPGNPSGGGTIMSYCVHQVVGVNFNKGFGIQPGNLIRNNYNNAWCKRSCGSLCDWDIAVTLDFVSGNNVDFEANNTITAYNTIYSGATVGYDAGSTIRLLPGFHAQSGSDFHAFIDGCGGVSPLVIAPEDATTASESFQEWELSSDEITTKEANKETFLKVYPNPFQGSTNVIYNLPEKGIVKLSVYDNTGREVAILENNVQKEQGEYQLKFDASKLPKGIYFIRMLSDKYNATSKMVITD